MNKESVSSLSSSGSFFISPSSTLPSSISPSIPLPSNTPPIDKIKSVVGHKWKKMEEVMKNIPDQLESKFYSYSTSSLLRGEKIVSYFNNTTTYLITPLRQPDAAIQVKGGSSLITSNTREPWMVSVYDDGMVQVYNTNTNENSCIPLLDKSVVKQYTSVLVNEEGVFLVSTAKILFYPIRYGKIELAPREIAYPEQVKIIGINQSYCRVLGDSAMLALASNFELFITNVAFNTVKVMGSLSTSKTQAAFLIVECSETAVVAVTRTSFFLWTIKDGVATQCEEIKVEQDVIVSCVHVDRDFVFIGYSNGLIAIRDSETGQIIRELNVPNTTINAAASDDWNQQITGIQLNAKVNVMQRVGKWIFCGFHNGRACVFNLAKAKTTPIAEYEHYNNGHIKNLIAENSMVFLLVLPEKKKKKKQDNNDDLRKPEVIVWQPAFKKKEDTKVTVINQRNSNDCNLQEFELISEYQPSFQYDGRAFDKIARPIKRLAVTADECIYSLQGDNSILAWDMTIGKIIYEVPIPAALRNAKIVRFKWAFGLLFVVYDNAIQTFNTQSKEWVHNYVHQGAVTEIVIEPNILHSVAEDGNCNSWDYSKKTSNYWHTFICHPLPINCATIHDGLLYTGSDDKSVKSFALRGFKHEYGEMKKIFVAHTDSIVDLAVLVDNFVELLFTYSRDCTVRCWDRNTTTCIRTVNTGDAAIRFNVIHNKECIVFTIPPKKQLNSRDIYVLAWDLRAGSERVINTFTGHKATTDLCITATVFNKCILFTGSRDKTIKAWDAETGQLLQTYHTHHRNVNDLVFFNQHFYVASDNGTIVECTWEYNVPSPPVAKPIPQNYRSKALPTLPPTTLSAPSTPAAPSFATSKGTSMAQKSTTLGPPPVPAKRFSDHGDSGSSGSRLVLPKGAIPVFPKRASEPSLHSPLPPTPPSTIRPTPPSNSPPTPNPHLHPHLPQTLLPPLPPLPPSLPPLPPPPTSTTIPNLPLPNAQQADAIEPISTTAVTSTTSATTTTPTPTAPITKVLPLPPPKKPETLHRSSSNQPSNQPPTQTSNSSPTTTPVNSLSSSPEESTTANSSNITESKPSEEPEDGTTSSKTRPETVKLVNPFGEDLENSSPSNSPSVPASSTATAVSSSTVHNKPEPPAKPPQLGAEKPPKPSAPLPPLPHETTSTTPNPTPTPPKREPPSAPVPKPPIRNNPTNTTDSSNSESAATTMLSTTPPPRPKRDFPETEVAVTVAAVPFVATQSNNPLSKSRSSDSDIPITNTSDQQSKTMPSPPVAPKRSENLVQSKSSTTLPELPPKKIPEVPSKITHSSSSSELPTKKIPEPPSKLTHSSSEPPKKIPEVPSKITHSSSSEPPKKSVTPLPVLKRSDSSVKNVSTSPPSTSSSVTFKRAEPSAKSNFSLALESTLKKPRPLASDKRASKVESLDESDNKKETKSIPIPLSLRNDKKKVSTFH